MPKHMPKEGIAGDGSKTTGQSSAEETRAADALALRGRPGGELGASRSERDVGMSSTSFPLLTRTNYPSWSLLMKVIMEAQHMWKTVDTGDVEYEEDWLAMEAILRSVPSEMVLTLGAKKTTKEAWETIKTLRIGVERVRESKAQTLHLQYEEIRFKAGEQVDDFALRLQGLVNELAMLRDPIDNKMVILKFLRIVPRKYKQLAWSIESLVDISTITIEELVGRLKVAEERGEEADNRAGGELLLTREQWDAQLQQHGRDGSSGSGEGALTGSRSRDSGGGRAQSGGGNRGRKPSQAGRGAGNDGKCRYFNMSGHWIRDCHRRKADVVDAATANLVQADVDGGPAMMLARVKPVQESSASPATTALTTTHSVWGARSPSTGTFTPVTGHTSTTTFLGPVDWEAMKARVWGSHTPAMASWTTSGPDKIAQVGAATTHMADHAPTMMLVTIDSVQERTETQVIHTPTMKCSGSTVADGSPTTVCACDYIFLNEERAVTTPTLAGGKQSEGWFLDTGATNHMTDSVDAFAELDRSITRKVRFADGSMVDIHGRGTVIFADKGVDHRAFTDVYFIPTLKSNVMSVRQLDEGWLDIGIRARCSHRARPAEEAAHGGGRRYILLLVDDYSRFMWVLLLTSKDEAERAIVKQQAAAEVECGHKLRMLCMDHGDDFTSAMFFKHCKDKGVQRHLTATYSSQQNGVVERRNQTVLGMARYKLRAKQVPSTYWGEAVLTTVFILNRSFTRSVDGKTPYEASYGRKPVVRFLRTFGCVGHIKTTHPQLKKLDDRRTPMVFMGYETGSKAYKMYDPVSKCVHVSRDIVFDKDVDGLGRHRGNPRQATPSP
ncbi:uncharacterized protein [Aegilops tauschii subsp. strangulata]|uniref:uncharacterized protein n=1 Tax=Aegilops tauschii subsp. strangulata TaxID=200361 RepID=UPI003CC87D02